MSVTPFNLSFVDIHENRKSGKSSTTSGSESSEDVKFYIKKNNSSPCLDAGNLVKIPRNSSSPSVLPGGIIVVEKKGCSSSDSESKSDSTSDSTSDKKILPKPPCQPAQPLFTNPDDSSSDSSYHKELEHFKQQVLLEIAAAQSTACRSIAQQCAAFDITEYIAKFENFCGSCQTKFHDEAVVKAKEELTLLVSDFLHGTIENQIKAAVSAYLDPCVAESVKAIQEAGALTVDAVENKISNGQSTDIEVARLKKELNLIKERTQKVEKQLLLMTNLLTSLAQSPVFKNA